MKKCVIISDSFKGTLSSLEICEIARQSIPRFFPACEVVATPVADGGEGTVLCFLQALQAQPVVLDVSGPYGEIIPVVYCRSGCLAVIEMATAAGLPMVEGRKHPGRTTTYGVGQQIRHAVEHGCTKILLGLGGSCTNDGGCGAASALGTEFLRKNGTKFVPVGETLDQIAHIDTTKARQFLAGIQITAMCDVDNPLFGPHGAAYIFAPQKGASPSDVVLLDNQLKALDSVIRSDLGLSLGSMPGTGAAGGMGAGCVAFLGGTLKFGIESVLDVVDFDRQLKGADLVITGEGRIDTQSVHGKVISGIAKRTSVQKIPLIVIAGSIAPGAEALYELGVTAMFGTDRQAVGFPEVSAHARENYQKTMEDILRLIQAKIS